MPSLISGLMSSKFIAHFSKKENKIERPALLAKLEKTKNYPLTLLAAPAGYGKTTLMAEWQAIQTAKHQRVSWLSLDKSDNQAVEFARYFTQALRDATHLSFSYCLFQGDLTRYFHELLLELQSIRSPFYLILDDYHLIENAEIHEAIRFWLKHQPETMHLILLSRTLPPISITQLRLREKLLEISVNDLAFDLEQSRQLIEQATNITLSETALHLLYEHTQGWISALQLLCFSLNSSPEWLNTPEKLFASLSQQYIEDYLSEEVFHFIPSQTQYFMQCCAQLHKMNEHLVFALTKAENGIYQLAELEKQGLFVQRNIHENGETWWQFHPILSDFLRQRCRIEHPQIWRTLHHLAITEWLKLGNGTEALYHAQILEEPTLLYKVLQEYGWELFHQGQLKLLEECLNLMPAEQIWQDSNLVLLKAWLSQSQHRYQEVSGILQNFKPNQPLEEDLQAHFEALQAQVAINEGNEDLAYQLANRALVHFSSKVGYAQIVANSIIGEAQHCQGYLKEGLQRMQKVEKMALEHSAYHQWLWSKLQQAEMLSAQGFLQSAYDLLKDTTQQAQLLHKIPMHEFLFRLRGQILWEWHHLDEAEEMANAGIEVLEKESEQAHCLALIAKISLTKGNLTNASRLIEQGKNLLASHSVHRDWLTTFDEVQLYYWQISEEKAPLEGWLAQTTFPTQEHNHFLQRQWRNIARCYLLQAQFDKALEIVNRLLKTTATFNLISDTQRALILRNRIYYQQGQHDLAQRDLIQALNLSQQTNFISVFVIEGELMAEQIRQLLQINVLDDLSMHKAKFILRSINQHHRHKFAHFDEEFVSHLLKNPQLPELLKISPLTSREWQVLGLIYAGYSNEQISQELVVAITTIKTHIRNLYQKIGVENRIEAIEYTKSLLKMMGYN